MALILSAIPYRADIDGLRAIAVLSVIFFHADFAWAQGGFVGVDVFFVISGYLITGILQRELLSGTFSLRHFYERRARRILPALIVVVAATLGACAVLMFPTDLRVVARSAVAVNAFAANFMFWRGIDFGDMTVVNYFGRRIHEQPLVHTWSLGVEEQYYLLFPISLWVLWKLRRSWTWPVVLLVTLASFALCVKLTSASPGFAFYLLPTRAWQLLLGGLMAGHGRSALEQRAAVRESAALAGVALVVGPVLVFNSAMPFPGYAALAPVAGAALMLRLGAGTRVGGILSWRPIVFVGLISYSAYLWHQPLFALARYVKTSGRLETLPGLVLSSVTLLLAAATWRWVETPFRNRRVVSSRTVWISAAAGTLAVATPAALLAFNSNAGLRTPLVSNFAGQAFMSLISDCSITKPTRGLGTGCVLNPSLDAPPGFVVVGDSHSEAMFPAFAKISRDTGVQGRLLQQPACSPLVEVTARPTSTPDCIATRDLALQIVAESHVPSVFLVSRFTYEYAPMTLFEERLAKTVEAYASRGALVHLVVQAPEHQMFVRRTYLHAVLGEEFFGRDAGPAIAAMASPRAEHDQRQAFVTAAFEKYRHDPRVRIVDFTSVLCDQASCTPGTHREPYYVDEHHLNANGALLVSGEIARQSVIKPAR